MMTMPMTTKQWRWFYFDGMDDVEQEQRALVPDAVMRFWATVCMYLADLSPSNKLQKILDQ